MKCKILKEIGVISKTKDYAIKLQLISWDDNPAKYDLRPWSSDNKAKAGITFTKEELLRIVELYEKQEDEEEEVEDVVEEVDEEDDDEEVILTKPVRTTKATKTTKVVTTTKSKETKKSNVIKFPEPKKDIEVAKTDGSYTYEDCEAKLDMLFEPVAKIREYSDMLMGLKEMAKVDNQFIQNAMREDRTFEGMMKYFYNHAQDNSISVGGNVYCMDDDLALCIFIDYFNEKEKPKEKKEPKTTKSKSTTKKETKTTSKKTTTKGKRIVKPLVIEDDDEDEEIPFN